MRTVAGHPLEGTYFNPRDTVKPPAALKKRVFPEVEEGLANLRKDPDNLEQRLSEVGFLRLMDFLRTVFLSSSRMRHFNREVTPTMRYSRTGFSARMSSRHSQPPFAKPRIIRIGPRTRTSRPWCRRSRP